MDFKTIPNEFRPVPFWAWNEKIDPERCREQIGFMHEAGEGGFFIHARGGLQTEFMGEEWFQNVEACLEETEKLGMDAWLYDENGWPSGFGNGRVNGMGERYWQKNLCMGPKPAEEHRIVAREGDTWFYYEVNPFYVDLLDPKVTRAFIEEIYEGNYRRVGSRVKGFFTDEPQLNRGKLPWSNILSDAYLKRYGDPIEPHLRELFEPTGDYRRTRVRYWKLLTDLFSQNYFKQIYDWCEARGLKFIGHLLMEESFASQMYSSGAVMPHYEYFSIPGMDCLGRNVIYDLTPYQVGSVAQQLGKKRVMTESFALCGHNVSFDELRCICGHQMIHGINFLVQHLQGFSLRGIRKRDYPPAMYYQQPWWPEYEKFCTAMARVGRILSEGDCPVDTLLIHPQTTAWTLYDLKGDRELEAFYRRFKQVVNDLDRKHIPFHLGDETIMERHAHVEGSRLVIGRMSYSTVVVPEHLLFLENTERLLQEFKANGGRIVSPEALQARTDVVEDPGILYTERRLEDCRAYYFLNDSRESRKTVIRPGSYILDQETGEKLPFTGSYTFGPLESLLVIDDGTPKARDCGPELRTLPLEGPWQIEAVTPNVLTLDHCDYSFDGEPVEKQGYVLNIFERAMALKRPVRIRQDYSVRAEQVPQELYLVCETPERFEIRVNGQPVKSRVCGWFRDSEFKKLDISGMLHPGENLISFDTTFRQSAETYRRAEEAEKFETEKNKLAYDMEIEPCYLIGDFGIRLDGSTEPLPRHALRFSGEFVMTERPARVTLTDLEKQGFPFFAGTMRLTKELELEDGNYALRVCKRGVNGVKARFNGVDCGSLLYDCRSLDGSKALHSGRNRITLELYNNLRNMLGPHHLESGESYQVLPASFFKEECVWSSWREEDAWNEDYCFVETSLLPAGGDAGI